MIASRLHISALVVACGASVSLAQSSYKLVDLGASAPGDCSMATAINDDGIVVGQSTLASAGSTVVTRAVAWNAESTYVFNPYTPQEFACALAINPSGIIVGQAFRQKGLFYAPVTVFAASAAIGPDLADFLALPADTSSARGINASLETTGTYETGPNTAESFFYTQAFYYKIVGATHALTPIPTLGGKAAWGNAINSSGTVVGASLVTNGAKRAFRWTTAGTLTAFVPFFGPSSEARAINDAGLVVGTAMRSDGRWHAFSATGPISANDLGTLGGNGSNAWGVNAAGVIVGDSWTGEGLVHAFVYRNVMTDLNDVTWNRAGWVLTHARGINAGGRIAGWGWKDGKTRAFVLVPQCLGDFDGSGGTPDAIDIVAFFDAWLVGDPAADTDSSGGTPDGEDIATFFTAWLAGC